MFCATLWLIVAQIYEVDEEIEVDFEEIEVDV